MAATSFIDSNLLKYETALNRLGARKSSKRQRPIVERGKISQQDAVAAAAQALAVLWNKGASRGSGGGR
jgi:hypothetical protein